MKPSDDDDIAIIFDQDDSTEDYHRKCIKRLYYYKIISPKFIKHTPKIKKKLRKKFTIYQSNLIFNKIERRIIELGPCKEWFLIFNEIKKIIKIIIKLISINKEL